MPFTDQIIRYGSLSVVGLGKNTGKTECLRYVMDRLYQRQKVVAVTSIGIDGEGVDRVTATPKPEIFLERECFLQQSLLITQKSVSGPKYVTCYLTKPY